MRFTSSDLAKWFYIAVVAVTLAACAQLPVIGGKEDDTQVVEDHAELPQAQESTAEDAPLIAIPRPESPSRVSVPAAAKQEFADAKRAMLAEDWVKAEGLLLVMTETYPKLAGVYTNLAIVYQRTGKLEEAEKTYQFAISTNKYAFDAYTNLGVIYREMGRFEEAESTYKDALALWPHHRESLINLGVLYDMYLGKLELALSHFELAQKLSTEEDRRLKGWIIDLQRRMAQQPG